jgi:hypothetical protein
LRNGSVKNQKQHTQSSTRLKNEKMKIYEHRSWHSRELLSQVKQAGIHPIELQLQFSHLQRQWAAAFFSLLTRISRRHGNQSKFAAAIDCPASGLAGTFCRSTSPGAAEAAQNVPLQKESDWSLGPFIVKCLDVKVFALAAASRPHQKTD